MTLVKIEIDLRLDKPVEVSYARVLRESQKYIYYSSGLGKEKALARASLHKPILETPVRGRYFLVSASDSKPDIRQSQAVQLGIIQLLDELEARMQRCAVRLGEAMEEAYACAE